MSRGDIDQKQDIVFYHISKVNPEKKVENTTRSRVFLTNLEVFGGVWSVGIDNGILKESSNNLLSMLIKVGYPKNLMIMITFNYNSSCFS